MVGGGLPRDHVPAGFVSRCAALIIDLLALNVAIAGAIWLVRTLETAFVPERAFLNLEAWLVATVPMLVIAYFVGLWRLTGQTIGKWLLGLRVVGAHGDPLTLWQALLRLAGYVLSALPLYAGFLWVIVDPQRRAWHDRLARTHVVYEGTRQTAHSAPDVRMTP